ncbi:MAG: hypothetical protein JW712_12515 [Dehalococcoidales bacterium]|nr:hypothetical protein [Dehalococcoidales bacterium]
MKRLAGYLLLVTLLVLPIFVVTGCNEKYVNSDELNNLVKDNDLGIQLRIEENHGGFVLKEVGESEGGPGLKIDVSDEFSFRGEAEIIPGNRYRLSITMKNTDSDPVICYSFWKKPVTSLRHYTLCGEDGNPPVSETQACHDDWATFEETFETREGEDSFMLTLHSGKGTFFIKEIKIVRING